MVQGHKAKKTQVKKTQLPLAAAMMLAPQASLTLTPTNKPDKSWYSLKAQNGNAS